MLSRHSRGASIPLAVTVMLLAASVCTLEARDVRGLGLDNHHRRNLQATYSVPVCAYDTTGQLGATWFAYCGVNPAWLIRHEGVSKLAKFDIALAKATFACGSHSLAAPAGPELTAAFEECINDTANFCYVAGERDNYQCIPEDDGLFAASKIPCPGTDYALTVACQQFTESECTGDCTWIPETLSPQALEQYLELRAETGGLYRTRGLCFPTQFAPMLTSFSDYQAFQNTYLTPSDPEDFLRVRGNCSYGIGAQERIAYDVQCFSFNDPSLGIMTGLVEADGTIVTRDIKADLATQCLLAGCDLDYIPADSTLSFTQGDFYQCNGEPAQRYLLGYYSREDVKLIRAVRACSEPGVRYNETRCVNQQL